MWHPWMPVNPEPRPFLQFNNAVFSQPGAGHSLPMRSSTPWNSARGTATSANWNTSRRAWRARGGDRPESQAESMGFGRETVSSALSGRGDG